MRNESVRIEFISADGLGTVNYMQTANNLPPINNISQPQTLNTPSMGGRPLLLGVMSAGQLNGMTNYARPFNGVIFRERSNENGEFVTPFTFNIIGTGIRKLLINFNRLRGNFATNLIIAGTEYANVTTPFVLWVSDTPHNTVTVSISSISMPNFPVELTSIYVGIERTYNRANGLKSLRRGSKSIANSQEVVTGSSIGQTASFEMLDKDGLIRQLAEMQLLENRQLVTFLDNDIVIGKFTFDRPNYDSNTNRLSVSLDDEMTDWYEGFIDPTLHGGNPQLYMLDQNRSARHLYNILCANNQEINYIDLTPFNTSTDNYLTNIRIDYFLVEIKNIRQSWRLFHDLTKTQGSYNENGSYVTRLI